MRQDAAREGYQFLQKELRQEGQVELNAFLPWLKRLLESDLELATNKAARVKAYQDHLLRMREYEENAQKQYQAGRIPASAQLEAKYLWMEAELWLAREKEK
jgi:hypothetical protein